MLERLVLTDPLLHTEAFLTPASVRKAEIEGIHVDFPLPEAPEDLKNFFTTEKGREFKKGFKNKLDELGKWALNNKLDCPNLNLNLTTFESRFDDKPINFVLYRQTLPFLVDCARLANDDTLPLGI